MRRVFACDILEKTLLRRAVLEWNLGFSNPGLEEEAIVATTTTCYLTAIVKEMLPLSLFPLLFALALSERRGNSAENATG